MHSTTTLHGVSDVAASFIRKFNQEITQKNHQFSNEKETTALTAKQNRSYRKL